MADGVQITVVNWRQHGDDESSLFTHVAAPGAKDDACGLIEKALGYPDGSDITSGDFETAGLFDHVYYTDGEVTIRDGWMVRDTDGKVWRIRFEGLAADEQVPTDGVLKTDGLGELASAVSIETANKIMADGEDYDGDDENSGDDLCDTCGKSGVVVDHTKDGQTVCTECAGEDSSNVPLPRV